MVTQNVRPRAGCCSKPLRRVPQGARPRLGQATVEFALMTPLLMLMAVGILEFGMLFKDHMAIHYASREGARVGAAASLNSSADCSILTAISTTMQPLPFDDLVDVHVFRAGTDGACQDPCAENVYARIHSTTTLCPGANMGWYSVGGIGWPSTTRNNGAAADGLGVDVEFTHHFFFNFLPSAMGNMVIHDQTVMQIEPALYRPIPTAVPPP